MERFLYTLIFICFLSSVNVFGQKPIEVIPETKNGYYLFFKSKPAIEYEYLGTEQIKIVMVSSSECETKIFKKLENYKDANGLIFPDLNFCEVEVIKLKFE